MAPVKELLRNILMELEEKELKNFKWLMNQGPLGNSSSIPRSQLEGADREDTVDLMVQAYGQNEALEIFTTILGKINRNDLVTELQAGSPM